MPPPRLSTVPSTRLVITLASLVLFATALSTACGPALPDAPDDADPWLVGVDADAAWLPVLATRDLAVGVARLAFTLEGGDADAPPPRVRAALYDLERDPRRPVASQYARFVEFAASDRSATPFTPHGHVGGFSVSDGLPAVGRGLYIVPVRLPRAGEWGIAFEISPTDSDAGGAPAEEARFRFSVRERPAAPAKGDPAPAVASRSLANAPLRELSSDPQPEPAFYQMSIADALAQRRPLVLAFATPAFCHSRACAPLLEVVKAVWRARAGELLALHIEVFENPHQPETLREAEPFTAWNLPSEPWVFVIDADGRIYSSYEGAVTQPELAQDVDEVLALWRAQREAGRSTR